MRTLFFREEEQKKQWYTLNTKAYINPSGQSFSLHLRQGGFYISPATQPVAGALDQQPTSRRCIVMIYPSNVSHYVLS